ncbi:Serine threonine- phosphatase 2A activator 1 protein [Rutstroemia sp. NJR-2017a BBW]|nr:Serine threonine- phosphatase 2A activator 1 protein [Rutstroemia sp. NJR-2017a BBW]
MSSQSPSSPNPEPAQVRKLPILDRSQPHAFKKPRKEIHEGHDVPHFLTSRAYADIGIFVMQLNIAMCPRKGVAPGQAPQKWTLDALPALPEAVQKLRDMLAQIEKIAEEAPPSTGPRRFGNVSFRKWFEILEGRVEELLRGFLPREVLEFGEGKEGDVSALEEVKAYLLGSFGSAQRLDYGTGHELSFLAFLGCIWKLGGFTRESPADGELERSIVMGVIEPYLRVVRGLILNYTLEPAGSHGVWGLDDHSFLPYIFGSSQYCPPITDDEAMPIEGSLEDSPKTGDIVKKMVVDRERKNNMYFSAIGFINDVKTGPFWEHSPILFDISGVRAGWGKINKVCLRLSYCQDTSVTDALQGMIKMYNAEVLSKFPVVQHFPFGSLFSWERDPHAVPAAQTVHVANQPTGSAGAPTARPAVPEGTRAPWANAPQTQGMPATTAPWANAPPSQGMPPTAAPWAKPSTGTMPPTTAPWANSSARPMPPTAAPRTLPPQTNHPSTSTGPARGGDVMAATRAPWATKPAQSNEETKQ